MRTPAAARETSILVKSRSSGEGRIAARCPAPALGSCPADGAEWQMLAVRAGESSPAANYTAQHRRTARSSRRCAAPSLLGVCSLRAPPSPKRDAICRLRPADSVRRGACQARRVIFGARILAPVWHPGSAVQADSGSQVTGSVAALRLLPMAQMASAWPAAVVIWTVLGARLAGGPKPWPGGLVTALPASSTTNEPAGVAAISPPLPESVASWAGDELRDPAPGRTADAPAMTRLQMALPAAPNEQSERL
jgi:hypothetical protein